MKKSDLKTGMRIEVRDGYQTGIIMVTANGEVTAPTACGCFHEISDGKWQEDLLHSMFSNLDITRVYDAPDKPALCDFNEKGKLLWERKEETITTIDGVEYSESTLRSIIKKAHG